MLGGNLAVWFKFQGVDGGSVFVLPPTVPAASRERLHNCDTQGTGHPRDDRKTRITTHYRD